MVYQTCGVSLFDEINHMVWWLPFVWKFLLILLDSRTSFLFEFVVGFEGFLGSVGGNYAWDWREFRF